jgi:hypothetical protein
MLKFTAQSEQLSPLGLKGLNISDCYDEIGTQND